jgi:hypothetical protein
MREREQGMMHGICAAVTAKTFSVTRSALPVTFLATRPPLPTGGIVTLLTRTLLLIASGTLTLAAQPLITIRPAPDQVPPGIAMRAPSDPSFQSVAGKLLGPSAIPLYQHILPYSTLIRNETPTPVIALVLTIQITDATGRTSKQMIGHFGSTPPGKKDVVVAPGLDMLFTPDPRFTQLAPILAAFNDAKQKQRLDELSNRPLESYISARAITLALDSVLFADGTVEGPDEENAFETWKNALLTQIAFDNSVLAFQDRSTEELR